MSTQIIPTLIKIIRDINLVDKEELSIMMVTNTQKLTKENFKSLVPNDEMDTFEKAVNKYGCDICDVECSEMNPIYTNKDYQGVDICSKCMEKAWPNMVKEEGWNPGPVYSLKKIVDLVSDTPNINLEGIIF